MREILFRGKSVDSGEWMYGEYNEINNYSYIRYEDNYGKEYREEIHPDSLGQFTGLTDKNGRKIFEGDIVQLHNQFYPIYWIDKYARFAAKPKGAVFAVIPFDQGEVVGNVHDNPELLVGVANG